MEIKENIYAESALQMPVELMAMNTTMMISVSRFDDGGSGGVVVGGGDDDTGGDGGGVHL